MSSEPILEVRNLSKTFSGRKPFTAVRDVSFTIRAGEIVGLLGPNGAGKTTSIMMLLNALAPTHGEIRYFGLDLQQNRSSIMQRVGFASGYARLPYSLTVDENLAVYGRLLGLHGAALWRRISSLTERFGCSTLRKRRTAGLSAGESTRVMLVKAFLGRPDILLLDEPTASLDPEICHEVRSFVQEARREHDVAMLYTSHNMPEVEVVCDRVMMLKNGQILAEGTPHELASTVSQPLLRLRFDNQIEKGVSLLHELGKAALQNGAWTETRVATGEIQPLLAEMLTRGIKCSEVDVAHPSLEDYFLKTAGESGLENGTSEETPSFPTVSKKHPASFREMRVDFRHSWAIALRYLHNFRRNGDRISDAIYWPVMDLILWGLTTRWLVA